MDSERITSVDHLARVQRIREEREKALADQKERRGQKKGAPPKEAEPATAHPKTPADPKAARDAEEEPGVEDETSTKGRHLDLLA